MSGLLSKAKSLTGSDDKKSEQKPEQKPELTDEEERFSREDKFKRRRRRNKVARRETFLTGDLTQPNVNLKRKG